MINLKLVGVGVLTFHRAGGVTRPWADAAHSSSALAGGEDGCARWHPHRAPAPSVAQTRSRTADPEQHVEAPYPGYLRSKDIYFVGTIRMHRQIYMQNVVDAYGSFGFVKLCLSKLSDSSMSSMTGFCLSMGNAPLRVEHVLTDNGRRILWSRAQAPF